VKHKVKQEPKEDGNYSLEAKRIKVEDDDEVQNSFQEIWATCAGSQIKLFQEDKLALEFDRLNDRHINFAQTLLRNQFSQCYGLQNTLLQGRHEYDVSTKIVQILHARGYHWVVISNLLCHDNEIKYYDTIYNDIDQRIQDLLNNMFGEDTGYHSDNGHSSAKAQRR